MILLLYDLFKSKMYVETKLLTSGGGGEGGARTVCGGGGVVVSSRFDRVCVSREY